MRGGLACAGRPVGSGRTRGGCIIIEEPRQLAELTADADMTLIRVSLELSFLGNVLKCICVDYNAVNLP